MSDYSCRNVTDRGKPVLLVAHDRNGEWQFLCGGDEHDEFEEIVVLHRRHLEDLDPTLCDVRDLPRGFDATREAIGGPWDREEFPEDDDDDADDGDSSTVCSHCGTVHDGPVTDRAFTLPDDVWSIPEPERAARAHFNSDLCKLGDRYFIRGVLSTPFAGREGAFGWGVWSEVEAKTFFRYIELYKIDAVDEPRASGTLANTIPCYADAARETLSISFGSKSARPEFSTLPESKTSLARDRSNGMSEERYHEILASLRNP